VGEATLRLLDIIRGAALVIEDKDLHGENKALTIDVGQKLFDTAITQEHVSHSFRADPP